MRETITAVLYHRFNDRGIAIPFRIFTVFEDAPYRSGDFAFVENILDFGLVPSVFRGKLGRHPRLGRALKCVVTEEEVFKIIQLCINLYKKKSTGGKRFAEIFNKADFNEIERF